MPNIKFGVEISKELNDSLNKMVPWGLKSRLFRIMLQRLEHELKLGGNDALAAWLNWRPNVQSVNAPDPALGSINPRDAGGYDDQKV